ncbi:Swi five-dependent recombination repair protein Sfr1 [Mactra antiquata]
MQKMPSDKSQLSSSLKERLKRCGRYHMSPYSTRPPEMKKTLECLDGSDEINVSSKIVTENPSKRVCMRLDRCNVTPIESDIDEIVASKLSESPPDTLNCKQVNKEHVLEPVSKFSAQNETPNCRRKSESLRIKGNKLSFESENICVVEKVIDESLSGYCNVIDDIDIDNNDISKINTQSTKMTESQSMKMTESQCMKMTESQVLKELSAREEVLRKLKMVKMYRAKNNLTELQTLIDKWRDVSQQALQDFYEAMPEPKPSLTQLINHLCIDHQLIRFKSENDEENFY